jgi:hypothetical protein
MYSQPGNSRPKTGALAEVAAQMLEDIHSQSQRFAAQSQQIAYHVQRLACLREIPLSSESLSSRAAGAACIAKLVRALK